jgi:hypothetical protein
MFVTIKLKGKDPVKQRICILMLLVAVLSLSGKTALSQINTYPVNQTVTISSGSFTIDVDSDGNDDYTFEILQLSGSSTAARVISIGNSKVMDSSMFGYPDALNFGDTVKSPYSSGNAVLGTDIGSAGQFSGAGMKYLGLNIDSSGDSHLGWISLEVAASNDTIILYDVGYNTTAGAQITAGQTNLTSVSEMSAIDFELYPNPCQNLMGINWPISNHELRYSISDINGKLLLHGTTTRNIDVSVLASGTYLLTIEEGQIIGRKKFMKK